MSRAADMLELTWEGVAGRKPQRYLVLRVERMTKESGGLFGLLNSPSLVDSFPDATAIEAHDGTIRYRLRGPGAELPASLKQGDRIAVGLVDERHFLCVLLPPDAIIDAAVAAWASTQPLN